MTKGKKTGFKSVISVRDLVGTFIRKKWIFIGFFLLTLITGLLITFLKTPIYQSTSVLKFGDAFFEENLYKYYPQEAADLEIYAPGMDLDEVGYENLRNASRAIRGEELLNRVSSLINIGITEEELLETLRAYIDWGNKIIRVVITYPDAEDSFLINQAFINEYLLSYRESRSKIIEDLVKNINMEINNLQNELEEINDESDSGAIKEIIIDLEKIKYNLKNNQDLYINNVELIQEPQIPSESINTDYLKNTIIVLFASVVVGLIAVYIPNIITSMRD
jgi:uncharacterized protein involved in exopolysaccharide biosynthesis